MTAGLTGARIPACPQRPGSAVLVTGSTGFIGPRIVHSLLENDRAVTALARSRTDLPAAERVRRAGRASARLDVVEADLSRAGGVTPAALERLAATVETVIHCAGDTSFFPDAMAPFPPPGTRWARIPALLGRVQAAVTTYHQNPSELDRVHEALKRAVAAPLGQDYRSTSM